MSQAVLLLWILFLGVGTARLIGWRRKSSLILAFPLGLGIMANAVLVGLSLGIDSIIVIFATSTIITLIFFGVIIWKTSAHDAMRTSIKPILALIASCAAIAILVAYIEIPFIKYTSDSFNYEGIGRVISNISTLDIRHEALFHYGLRRDPMLFSVHAFSNALGVDHFPLYYYFVGFVLPIMIILAIEARENSIYYKALIVIFVIGFMLSGHYITQSTVLLPNLTGALYFGVVFVLVYHIILRVNREEVARYLLTLCIICGIGALVRTELRYLNLLILLPAVAHAGSHRRSQDSGGRDS